jgi:hypothetical protein
MTKVAKLSRKTHYDTGRIRTKHFDLSYLEALQDKPMRLTRKENIDFLKALAEEAGRGPE